jgi:hypothetical protein
MEHLFLLPLVLGRTYSGKTADNSCALALVRRGAAAVVGSTCFSYGAGSHTSSHELFSDYLAQLVFSEFQSGVLVWRCREHGSVTAIKISLLLALQYP